MKPEVQSHVSRRLVRWAVFLLATWSSSARADGGQVLARVEDAHFRLVLMAPASPPLGEVELSLLVVSLPARLPQTEGVIELQLERDGRSEWIPFVAGVSSNRLLWVARWQPPRLGPNGMGSKEDRSTVRLRGCIGGTTFDHRVTLPFPQVGRWWNAGLEAILLPYGLLVLLAAIAGLDWRSRRSLFPEISPISG